MKFEITTLALSGFQNGKTLGCAFLCPISRRIGMRLSSAERRFPNRRTYNPTFRSINNETEGAQGRILGLYWGI